MKCQTGMLQVEMEVDDFIKLLNKNNVKSFLEIGSKFGGSIWRIANGLPKGSRIVSVDLPHGDGSFKVSRPALEECINVLRRLGYDSHLILGDSTDPNIIEKAYALGPYDAVFIDGNHTIPYIQKDFDNYSKITKMIAFHDIKFDKKKEGKKKIEVPAWWRKAREGFKYTEISYHENSNGIGVLWL